MDGPCTCQQSLSASWQSLSIHTAAPRPGGIAGRAAQGGKVALRAKWFRTFGIDPVRVQVGQSRLVAQLLNRLQGFVVDLEDATRSPPPAAFVCHLRILSAPTRSVGAHVVGDGARDKKWGRQFGGVVGVCRRGFATSRPMCIAGVRNVGAMRSHDGRRGIVYDVTSPKRGIAGSAGGTPERIMAV